jgi:hypothetical protein
VRTGGGETREREKGKKEKGKREKRKWENIDVRI